MNFGHSALISLEIFAYPYPGKSASSRSGSALSGFSRKAMKLMVRVLPGVELTCAIFSPNSALIKLDLPTFDRPRKATSGARGGGNCVGAAADLRKLAWIFIFESLFHHAHAAEGEA